MLIHI
jgi:hypothetical protein